MADSAAAAAATLKALIDSGVLVSLVTYADIAAATVFTYDYLLTLPMEIDLVWRSPWNIVKILYLVQRYMPFIDTCVLTLYRYILNVWMAFLGQLGTLDVPTCRMIPRFEGFLYIFGMAFSAILLSVRVWALWDRNKALSIVLPILFVALWSPGIWAVYVYTHSLKYIERPLAGFRGCFVVEASEIGKWTWAGILLWNTITLCLTLLHGYRSNQSGILKSRLTTIIYREGTYYYVYLFTFSLLQILFTLRLQPSKRVIILSIDRCFHSIFSSRVLLHMRSKAQVLNAHAHDPLWSDGQGSGAEIRIQPYKSDIAGDSSHAMQLRSIPRNTHYD